MTNQEYVVFNNTMIVLRYYYYTIIKSRKQCKRANVETISD